VSKLDNAAGDEQCPWVRVPVLLRGTSMEHGEGWLGAHGKALDRLAFLPRSLACTMMLWESRLREWGSGGRRRQKRQEEMRARRFDSFWTADGFRILHGYSLFGTAPLLGSSTKQHMERNRSVLLGLALEPNTTLS
jgi:hypothetical protein